MELCTAQSYTAAIHMQGGAALWARVPRVSEVSWGRTLDDYSEANITVAKQHVSDECVSRLGRVRTWGQELTIYRDGEFVWQGPITEKSEYADRFEFEARDMLAWLDRRRNAETYNWTEKTDQNPDGTGPYPVGSMAELVLHDAFDEHDPGFLDYLEIDKGGPDGTLQAMRKREKDVGELLRDLLDYGLDMYTLGRNIYFRLEKNRDWFPTLTLTEQDFTGELELREVGTDAATRVTVTGEKPETEDGNTDQDNPDPMGTWPVPPDGVDDFFGLIEQSSDSDTATTDSAARTIAKELVRYNNPPPMAIIIPSSAQLSPRAQVSIHDLVPSRPVMVRLLSYHTSVHQRFLINEVKVEASESSGGAGEEVELSLTSDEPGEMDDDA